MEIENEEFKKITDKRIIKQIESLEKLRIDLTQWISLYITNVKHFIQYKEMTKDSKVKMKEYGSIDDKIKSIETHYDKIFETNERTRVIVETGEKIERSLKEFDNLRAEYSIICANMHDQSATELNNMLDMMKELEIQRKPKERDMTLHQRDNYDNYMGIMYDNYRIKTKAMKEKEHKDKIEEQEEILKKMEKLREEKQEEMEKTKRIERYEQVQNWLSKDQFVELETLSEKWIGNIIFDSTQHKWKRNQSEFGKNLSNKSPIAIIIFTPNKTFGCYISKPINQIGEYIEDPNAYLFNLNGMFTFNQFKIKDKTNIIISLLSK